ncbi:predicted protein [Nematostella vectensis]|uniref:pyridoxal 5'-phosphate synthase n=2 Tax=Nematostella vectensis TaxID=45351 RepID=A7RG83_NEMVE|nr:predicted protein [Nematostella vectensis]|eukprot:XP_001641547.1 predicted protein [Nematostella vectensis]
MRIDYGTIGFGEENVEVKEPIAHFDTWFREAAETEQIQEPNAMTLATCGKDGYPSARTVLLKGYTKEGFTFYTNYESQKGKQLMENPYACLLFFWQPLHRQVTIRGPVVRVSEQESTDYFHSRPRGSQIGASVSHQSSVIKSREVLSEREKELKEKYADESITIPKPDYWGGYTVIPESIEFWQGQTSRLHDRILFRKPKPDEKIDPELTKHGNEGWVYERLSP